jgi:hypothetical protein
VSATAARGADKKSRAMASFSILILSLIRAKPRHSFKKDAKDFLSGLGFANLEHVFKIDG